MSDSINTLDLAEACVAGVKKTLGMTLDYTQDTLPILDHYLSLAEGSRKEVIALFVPMCGSYFGEVVRRHLGPARWHSPADEPGLWRIEFELCFLYFNPLGVALEAFTQRTADGWAAHLQMAHEDKAIVAQAMHHAGGVREEDYYRFGVRYEGIELTRNLMVRRSAERGDHDVHYGAEVYASVIRTGSEKDGVLN